MATNLRLRPAAEEAVRAEAARTGRSQQELIRHAVDRYLGLDEPVTPRSDAEALLAAGAVLPARSAFRVAAELIDLPAGVETLALLDRDERV